MLAAAVRALPAVRDRRSASPATGCSASPGHDTSTAEVPRQRFAGQIAGVGSSSGVRIVVGRWAESPLGTFADVMLAEPDGTRVLLAPVAGGRRPRRHDVPLRPGGDRPGHRRRPRAPAWRVHVRPASSCSFEVGRRPCAGPAAPAGAAPDRHGTRRGRRVTDPVARILLRGVRTRGTAGNGRREYYGATDLHRVAEPRRVVAGRRPRRAGAGVTRAGLRVRVHPGAALGHLDRHHHRPAARTGARLPAWRRTHATWW